MAWKRTVGVVMVALGSLLAVVLGRRRSRRAMRAAVARRFVSRRAADRDARDQRALERWGNEGGAI